MDFKNQDDLDEILLKYNFAKKILDNEVDILISEYSFNHGYNPVEHIKSRIKTIDSAVNKLVKKGYSVNLDNLVRHVHDMVGVRIVCSFVSDVYDVVNMLKSSKNFIVREESDYIKNPKDSGYSSYHINVLVPIHLQGKIEYMEAEIQIRTVAMDCWASLDHKLRYKFPGELPKNLVNEMIDCAYEIAEIDDKMQKINEHINSYSTEN